MRYSTVPAINLEAHIARNRELINKLPEAPMNNRTWCPELLRYVYPMQLTYEATSY